MPIMRANPSSRRRKPAKKKRATRPRRTKSTAAKRSAAAKKAASTRRRKAAKRSAAAKKGAATRRRKARRVNPAPKRRRRATKRVSSAPKRRATKRRAKRVSSAPKRRRRSTTRRSAPKRRYNRRRRSNPGMNPMLGKVLHLTGGFFANSALTGLIAPRVPMLDRLPMGLGRPALSAAITAALYYGKKKVGALKKLKLLSNDVIAGSAVCTVKEIVGAIAPANIKAMIGLGSDIYGPGLDDYVQLNDYVAIGDAPPIDDDIALADYLSVGGIEQDLGATIGEGMGMDYDLGGMTQDLGDWATVVPGGVSRSAMSVPITKHKQLRAGVPDRSFTAPVKQFGAGFDSPGRLDTGIFAGGFGS